MSRVVSLIIPTYKERDNILPLVEGIHRALHNYSYRILIVDDDSQDGTAELVGTLSPQYPIDIVVRKNKRGLASAVVDGIARTTGETIVVMDADLQHPPEVLPDLLRKIDEGADMAIASRYVPGGACQGWGLARRVNSKGAIFIAHLLLPSTRRIKDPMSGFFAFKRQGINGADLKPAGYKIVLEVLLQGKFRSVAEVPFTFRTRSQGQSKLSFRQQIDYLKHIYSLMRRSGELLRFIKFCLVGASGVGVNLGLFWLLTRFGGLKEEDFLALAIAVEASIVSNFSWNELFTFRDRRSPSASFVHRLFKFNLICLAGAGVQAGAYALLYHGLGIYDLVSYLAGIVLATLWNYLLNTWWTWR